MSKNVKRNHFISIYKNWISSLFICGYGHYSVSWWARIVTLGRWAGLAAIITSSDGIDEARWLKSKNMCEVMTK